MERERGTFDTQSNVAVPINSEFRPNHDAHLNQIIR